MIKLVRVCDESIKEGVINNGIVKLQGFGDIQINNENLVRVEKINDIELVKPCYMIDLSVDEIENVSIFDIKNVSMKLKQDLTNGKIQAIKGKYNGIDATFTYNGVYNARLDIQLLMYNEKLK